MYIYNPFTTAPTHCLCAIGCRPCHKKQNGAYPATFSSYEEVMDQVAARNCSYALVDGGTAGVAVNGRYCNTLVTTGEPFVQRGVSFVLPRGAKGMKEMRKATLRFEELDMLDSMEKYFEKQGPCPSSGDVVLSFYKLRVFFGVVFVVCLLLLIEMILDVQEDCKAELHQEGYEGCEDGFNKARSKDQLLQYI